MDPNLALSRLRSLVKNVNREADGTDEPFTPRQCRNILNQFAENFEALDNWVMNGGFLPENWDHAANG
jgi:hypothetical protein